MSPSRHNSYSRTRLRLPTRSPSRWSTRASAACSLARANGTNARSAPCAHKRPSFTSLRTRAGIDDRRLSRRLTQLVDLPNPRPTRAWDQPIPNSVCTSSASSTALQPPELAIRYTCTSAVASSPSRTVTSASSRPTRCKARRRPKPSTTTNRSSDDFTTVSGLS